MPNISVSFRNNYIERRRFVLTDMYGQSLTVFDGDLDPDQSTGPLALVSLADEPDGGYVMWARLPDGENNTVEVQDGEEVSMI